MTVTKPLVDLTPRLRVAADYLHKVGWTTGTEKNELGQVCLTGAIRYCEPQNGDEYLIREVLRMRGHAENWNDGEATAAEVEEYLRTAEVTDADLELTFGPQWLQIVTLVREIFKLTDAQWRRVAASWEASWAASRAASWEASRDASWAASWEASRAASRDASRAASWEASRDASWAASRAASWAASRDASWAASWDASRDMAIALNARDLIGQHGFTQEHYDALTGPWRTTIGSIHPDDLDIYEPEADQ